MSLTTYERARPWARAIQEEVLERRMPPWGAVTGFGHFANDNSLTARETAIIVAWTQGGAPSGVPKIEESIPPVFVPKDVAWDQPPDTTLSIAAQTIEANAPLRTARVEVATGLTQARWLRAIAFKPGDRRVVHSAAFYDATSGAWLGAWTPWQTTFTWPAGAGVSLPAKGRLVVEIVYDGIEETVTDRAEVGLYFAAAPPAAKVTTTTITTPPSSLAAGVTSHHERATMTIAEDTVAVALWPRLSEGARGFEVTALGPDGAVTPLVWVKDHRPEWPSPYVLATPVTLSRGTRVTFTAYFDNDSDRVRPATAQVVMARYPAGVKRESAGVRVKPDTIEERSRLGAARRQ